jgi:hypothetical protein
MSRPVERLIATALLLAATTAAFAQERGEQSPVRRAPLADVESLEPAVDVSEPRVALIRRAEAQTATPVPAAPPAAAEAPRQAPAPPSPTAPTPQNRPAARATDSLDLGTTSITGNAELPKVLYIVPWKKSDLGDLVGRPINTLLDEVLAPVDPEVFERHLDYYETLHGASQEE